MKYLILFSLFILACLSQNCTSRLQHSSAPAHFCPKVWFTGLNNPRALLSISDDEILVVETGSSRISVLWETNGTVTRATLATQSGLNHAIEYYNGYLYASSATTVYRWPYSPGGRSALGASQQVITGMPYGGHSTRTFRFSPTGTLYVQCGSQGNVDSNTIYARIKKFTFTEPLTSPLNWNAGVLAYEGLRNEVGLRYDNMGRLWGVENGCDNLQRSDLGGVITEENPSEEVNLFESEGFYGYPYCWSEGVLAQQYATAPGTQYFHPSFPQYNDTWCRANAFRPKHNLRAHVAPLDILFNYKTGFPEHYIGGAFITEHGSWNRATPKGYRVQYLPFNPTTNLPAGPEEPFLYYDNVNENWPNNFRPVGLAFKKCAYGHCLYVSSDASDLIIEIAYHGPNSTTESTNASVSSSVSPSSSDNVDTKESSNAPILGLYLSTLLFIFSLI